MWSCPAGGSAAAARTRQSRSGRPPRGELCSQVQLTLQACTCSAGTSVCLRAAPQAQPLGASLPASSQPTCLLHRSRRRCLFTMSNHTQAVTQVKWGGDGLIYSAARDCSINVWAASDGRMVRRWAPWRGNCERLSRLNCLNVYIIAQVAEPYSSFIAGNDMQPQRARPLGEHNEPQHRLCSADRRL